MELDLQVSPEEIMSREVELGCESWIFLLRVVQVVRQQQCNGHCLCDSAQARQLKQQLHSALVAGQWRGDTALTFPLFWRRSTSLQSFSGGIRGRAFTLSSPSHSVPVPNKPSRFRGRKATLKKSLTAARAQELL